MQHMKMKRAFQAFTRDEYETSSWLLAFFVQVNIYDQALNEFKGVNILSRLFKTLQTTLRNYKESLSPLKDYDLYNFEKGNYLTYLKLLND